jgi:hypothetical protein
LWWDPTQEDSYGTGDELTTVTDFSGNGNDGTAGNVNADAYATAGDGTWEDGVENSLPMFKFQREAASTNILHQWVVSPDLGFSPTDGSFLLFVAKRHTGHFQFNQFLKFGDNASPSSGTLANMEETDGAEGAGTQDEMKWSQTSAAGVQVFDGSDTTTLGIYGVKFTSPSSAILYYNGTVDPNGSFNPASAADTKEAIVIGEARCYMGDVVYVQGIPTDQQIADAFDWAETKWITGPGGGGAGDAPDPPSAAVQIDNSTESITVRVTMPTVAPDYIRIGVGSTRSYQEAVSVSGGATQDFVITGLTPSTSYPLSFRSVDGGLVSTAISIIGATDSEGTQTLDTLLYFEQSYGVGSQTGYVNVLTHDPGYSPALNHPLGTIYHVEISTSPSGPWTAVASGTDNGLSALLSFPYAQTTVSHLLYYRVWATKTGWTDSAHDGSSIAVPAR